MDFEQELKKFELSSVFTINFSWLKQYVESSNGIYTPIRNISDDDFREIESSFYALQAAWKVWKEAKAQAIPDGFVLVPKEPNKQFKNVLSRYLDGLCRGGYGCDLDGFVSVNGIDPNEIWQFMIEAQEQSHE